MFPYCQCPLVPAVSPAADLPLLALAVVAAAVGTLHDARRPRPAAAFAIAGKERMNNVRDYSSITSSFKHYPLI